MSDNGDVHVVWDFNDELWRVEVTGETGARGVHETKQAAIEQGRDIARDGHSKLTIHTKAEAPE